MNKSAIKIWVFYIMSKNTVNFGQNQVVGTGAGFHGVESRVEGTKEAAQRMVADNAFGQTGNLEFLRIHSVPEGDAVIGALENSNRWNEGATRGSHVRSYADIQRSKGAGGSRRRKSKQRKSRKSNQSKKRKSRKSNRRRR